jgi:hypothetical protein
LGDHAADENLAAGLQAGARDDLSQALLRVAIAHVRAILDGARLRVLRVKGPMAIEGGAQQDAASRCEHLGQRFDQALILEDVLDRLQADDLVERAELATAIAELTQIDLAKIYALHTQNVGSPARALLLVR